MASSLLEKAHPLLPAHLLERLPAAQARAEASAEIIKQRLAGRVDEFHSRIRALQTEPGEKKDKLRELRQLTAELEAFASDQVACRKGCSHCCHVPVAVLQGEANLIADEIGVPAQQLTHTRIPSERGYGYHMACPFLVQDACSIYAHRPMTCRTHLSLDQDALLCGLLPDMKVPVPLLDMSAMQQLYVDLFQYEAMGDIRDFFPSGLDSLSDDDLRKNPQA
jgi:Fe-S-cluster containining protein